jgi:hypothetical protein
MEVASSHVEGNKMCQVVEKALDTYLDKNDPMIKAQRAQLREEKKLIETSKDSIEETTTDLSEEREVLNKKESGPLSVERCESSRDEECIPGATGKRNRYIPAGVRHEVMLRDEGRCTYVSPDGKRCNEKRYLEFDHFVPFCHGGEHSILNIKLVCNIHNQFLADQKLGRKFMESKRRE